MTVNLGNAGTGNYNFSVDTKLISAAVAAKLPGVPELVTDGATAYFGGANSAVLGANAAASDLLNGNYTLTAAYADPTNDNGDGQITVTANGDNGQTFTATITAASLTALSGSKTLNIKFNQPADDAFNLTLNLTNFVTAGESNYDTLASNISKLSVSVTGGVTARAAEFGVYANLTGANGVQLESGMNSVTFDNGVKVNFDTLTASSVDTANKARLDDAGTAILAGNNNVAAGAAQSGYAITYKNFKAIDNSSITNSSAATDFAIVVNGAAMDATIGGKTYSVTPTASQLDALEFASTDTVATTPTKTQTLTFTDSTGNAAFTIDVVSTLADATGGSSSNTATTVALANLTVTASANGVVENVGHNYAKIFSASTTDLSASTASSFSVEATKNAGLTFQVGANEGDSMVINVEKMDANYLGVASASVATRTSAAQAIKSVDKAINQVSQQRANLGAVQNRLEYKISNLNTSGENLTSAESQIRDVDMAKEMTNFTNANILNQAATAMLAQANSLPQTVLSLIGK
jgi:flagellin